MFAIVEIVGHQHKVSKGDVLTVEKLEGEVDAKLKSDKVLLKEEDGKIEIGTPYLEKSGVEFKILSHGKGDKIRVYKKKSKKRYERTQGHRQPFTKIEITAVK